MAVESEMGRIEESLRTFLGTVQGDFESLQERSNQMKKNMLKLQSDRIRTENDCNKENLGRSLTKKNT